MTTKTTITLSPIKRCYTSPNLRKRRITSLLTNRKHQMICEKQKLPDLVNDIYIEQQRRETIINIATILRKVGDQMDTQLQMSDRLSSSSNHIFGQRTLIFVNCLSHVLHFFL